MRAWAFRWTSCCNAIVAGLLLGGFYAAVTVGISISFGMLDIVNIAHPAFIILGSYIAYIVNATTGVDPILAAIVMLPVFYLLGTGIYQVYYVAFEKRGQEALRGLAFFFGLLFITEVGLILVFGVDYRYVEARLHRADLAHRLRRLPAAHAGAVRGLAADGPRPAAVPDAAPSSAAPSWPWRRTSWRCGCWPPTRSASSAWPSASRSPPRRWPAPS